MNPPSEEGKKEPRGGLGVTRRVAGVILIYHLKSQGTKGKSASMKEMLGGENLKEGSIRSFQKNF